MSEDTPPKVVKLKTKKTKTSIKVGNIGEIKTASVEDYKTVDDDNKQLSVSTKKNTVGLDTDRLGNIGKFVHMDDEELFEHVPKGGDGSYNKLTQDERDSRLVLVHRYHLRGWTNQRIAKKLGVSTRMVSKIKDQIKDLHRRSFSNVDLNQFLGETVAFFQEVRNMSMALAGDKKCTPKEQISALKVASDTEMNKIRFLDYCGVFAYIRGNSNTAMEEVINTVPESDKDAALAAMDEFALKLFDVN